MKLKVFPSIFFMLFSFLAVTVTGCSAKKESVTLSLWGSKEDLQMLEEMVGDFIQHYKKEADISVTICEESERTCKETVLLCPQAAADVYTFADDQFNSLCQAGALLPLSIDRDNVIISNGGFNSGSIEAALYNHELYAYPLTASNGYFLYYNAAYFSEDDVNSLERILEVAESNNKHFVMEFSSGWYLYSFYKAAGLNVYKIDESGKNFCNWNATDNYIEGSLISGADVTNKLIDIASSNAFLNIGNDEFVAGIKDGSIIAGVSGTWTQSAVSEAFGENYRACKLPSFTVNGKNLQMHSVVGFKFLGVNAYTKYPEWSQKLALWLTSEENQLKRFEVRGEGPANIKLAKSPEVKKSQAIAALTEQSEFGHIQNVADVYWDATYRFGNEIVSGNIENRNIQTLLDDLVMAVTSDEK